MGGPTFVRRVPSSVDELRGNMMKLHENINHVSSIKTNATTNHIEIDLDRMANSFGGDDGKDFYIPIRKGKDKEAQEIIDRMLTQSRSGFPPSDKDIRDLYALIDPTQ
jgi:hypothetical protein